MNLLKVNTKNITQLIEYLNGDQRTKTEISETQKIILNDLHILNESLWVVTTELLILAFIDKTYLNGESLALYAKRLMSLEIQIGGPYKDEFMYLSNSLIAQLFRLLGSPLLNIEKFIQDNYLIYSDSSNPMLRFSTSWPHSYIGGGIDPPGLYSDFENILFSLVSKKMQLKKSVPIIVESNNEVVSAARRRVLRMPPNIQPHANDFIEKILAVDKKNEISLITKYMLGSLSVAPTRNMLNLAYELGVANMFAWVAYTTYDNLIDDEGEVSTLPLANTMHRESFKIYCTNFPNDIAFISKFYNSVDSANLWEMLNLRPDVILNKIYLRNIPRFKNLKFLSNRSIGHALGPELMVRSIGQATKMQLVKIHRGFEEYLIAKQLSDDIEDWETDIRRGQLSSVSSQLLIDSQIPPGEYDIDHLIAKLKPVFWDKTLSKILKKILKHVELSEIEFKESHLLMPENILFRTLLAPIKLSAENSLQTSRESKAFLAVFKT